MLMYVDDENPRHWPRKTVKCNGVKITTKSSPEQLTCVPVSRVPWHSCKYRYNESYRSYLRILVSCNGVKIRKLPQGSLPSCNCMTVFSFRYTRRTVVSRRGGKTLEINVVKNSGPTDSLQPFWSPRHTACSCGWRPAGRAAQLASTSAARLPHTQACFSPLLHAGTPQTTAKSFSWPSV